MTVIFQEKFIYMPYMPPFARSERIEDYMRSCQPVVWREERIRSTDGTNIGLAVGRIPAQGEIVGEVRKRKEVVLCYFQGNGSSLPPRLPLLSHVLRLLHSRRQPHVTYTIAALSYRGYWTSSGRPTQPGIEMDAQAFLRWIGESYPLSAESDTEIMLWGQSIGAGIAATAAGAYLCSQRQQQSGASSAEPDNPPITALIMETPFTSVRAMLFALYPQKWLPYQYLHPFLRNHWDSEEALRRIANSRSQPRILLVSATRDEVVPSTEVKRLEEVCKSERLVWESKRVIGALHTEATMRREGQEAVAGFVESISNR